MNSFLSCGDHRLDLSKPVVMGILNVTPDSFSDGGQHFSLHQAEKRALAMQQEGASIIDIGGESTRPGAKAVGLDEELERVIPVIERLASILEIPLSIDTSKPEVMRAAVNAGAGMINDVMALQHDNALDVVVGFDSSIAVCLMHMQGSPRSMQASPAYKQVLDEVLEFLAQRISQCLAAGLRQSQLLVDPGFGFGKTLEHNLSLLANLSAFRQFDLPVLTGISRKSMIGGLLDNAAVDERLFGSIAAAVLAYERGAQVIRVHDVKETVDALTVTRAVIEHT